MTNKPAQQMSADERAALLEEARQGGVLETCRKYGISSKTYYHWLAAYEQGGISALTPQKSGSGTSAEVTALRRENERLKKLLAEKELALDIKEELLKKTSLRLMNAKESPVSLSNAGSLQVRS